MIWRFFLSLTVPLSWSKMCKILFKSINVTLSFPGNASEQNWLNFDLGCPSPSMYSQRHSLHRPWMSLLRNLNCKHCIKIACQLNLKLEIQSLLQRLNEMHIRDAHKWSSKWSQLSDKSKFTISSSGTICCRTSCLKMPAVLQITLLRIFG